MIASRSPVRPYGGDMKITRIILATSGDVPTAATELPRLASGGPGFRDGDAWYHVDVPDSGLRLAVDLQVVVYAPL
jgi:hypothetical protein